MNDHMVSLPLGGGHVEPGAIWALDSNDCIKAKELVISCPRNFAEKCLYDVSRMLCVQDRIGSETSVKKEGPTLMQGKHHT